MAAPTLDRVDAPTGAQTVTLAEASEERREDIVLRRLRAGRRRMPIGASNLLWTRAHVDDVARQSLPRSTPKLRTGRS